MPAIRYSGVRLDRNSHLFLPQLDTIIKKAIPMALDIVNEARKEPYFFFDHDKPKTTETLIQEMLYWGELFLLQKDQKTIGYACFRGVVTRRFAVLELYMLPEYRKHIILGEFRDILYKAAFAPYPEGLQLVKLKAFPHPLNTVSIKTCKKAGFVQICELFMEGLLNGQLCNMILLELYPKEIQDLNGEILNNGRTKLASNSDAIRRSTDSVKHRAGIRKKSAKLPEHIQQPAVQS